LDAPKCQVGIPVLAGIRSEKAGLSTSGWVRNRLARVARREIREMGDDPPPAAPG
jgi:hypothetical protein